MQHQFLSHLKSKKDQEVSLYLVNGIKLVGFLIDFDDHSILLKRDSVEQLIYKHSIATIVFNPVTSASVYANKQFEKA